eukprot:494177-Alexandrium_andersonii.AAC.1
MPHAKRFDPGTHTNNNRTACNGALLTGMIPETCTCDRNAMSTKWCVKRGMYATPEHDMRS